MRSVVVVVGLATATTARSYSTTGIKNNDEISPFGLLIGEAMDVWARSVDDASLVVVVFSSTA